MSDKLQLRYIPLSAARQWERNPKRHDLPSLVDSIQRHGFKDPPKFEPELNGGEGGIVEGNGRISALHVMHRDGRAVPRGVALDDDDEWLVPVLFGVDADGQHAAEAYGVDHNNLTLSGANLDDDLARGIWYEGEYAHLVETLQDAGESPVITRIVNVGDLMDSLADDGVSPPEEFDEYGDDIDTEYCCPSCGYEWSGAPK